MEWLRLGSDIDGEAESDNSGRSVSLSADGTRVAIGARFNGGSGYSAGHVRIYEWNGTAWSKVGLDIDGEAVNDQSGYSVSLSANGTRVAIGASYNDGTAANAGHVRIYEFSNDTWVQMGSDINGEAEYDYSGDSVSLSADGLTVAIGATWNDGTGSSNAGHVRIYELTGGDWSQVGSDINGEAASDESGWSVSLSADGTRVAIGASYNDGSGSSNAGHVRIYEFSSGDWVQLGSDINGEAANDQSGYSVSLSEYGTRVAIGARFNGSSDAGHVRIYELTGGDWVQMGDDIDGEAADDFLGQSVSLSADGLTVAIGATNNDGNGSNAGHVRIYEFSSGTWSQLGQDIDGEAENDYSGFSVSLSADGSRVAIGAVLNDPTINGATANNAGHVRIYELVSTTTTEAPTHQTILSLESFGPSTNETTGKTNYVWQLKATTTSL